MPGCGKTFLLGKLKKELDQDHFQFFEGSQAIEDLLRGGLEAFHRLSEQEKAHWRQMDMHSIRDQCIASGRAVVVAGHFMFWSEEKDVGQAVYTEADLETYTHIIYMDVPADIHAEKVQLKELCDANSIPFASLPSPDTVSPLLLNFRQDTSPKNHLVAVAKMDEILQAACRTRDCRRLETVLVLDADKTLAASDTGALFWKAVAGLPYSQDIDNCDQQCPLKNVFGSQLGYTYTAFRQVGLIYERLVTAELEKAFDGYCEEVASAVKVHPEFISLLRTVSSHGRILAVVVTCGLRRIWTKILAKEGLGDVVEVSWAVVASQTGSSSLLKSKKLWLVGGLLGRMLATDEKLSLVALRLSENKFTGRGGTDTGNRLFNTPHLD
ncbi:hypothetical protein B0H66DRAFT_632633 [Apodospora peruviana]|uniref:Uncharacterized protein n=1 Tax=Apodospora peruviana TaxID=516989 RepID=A0AAE0HSM4_9PEZI|nr:hypothetical protein B0H66DRAFT_632633 [Apodospora peruviana]